MFDKPSDYLKAGLKLSLEDDLLKAGQVSFSIESLEDSISYGLQKGIWVGKKTSSNVIN